MASGKFQSVCVTCSECNKQAAGNTQCARGEVVLMCEHCGSGITYQIQPQQKPQLLGVKMAVWSMFLWSDVHRTYMW